MPDYTPQMPHGPLERVFEDVFFVTGTSRPEFGGAQWQFSRNMTVVREGDRLTLINTVRLDDAGLAALEALGTVRHVVKLGAFHGIDDAFYVDRYRALQWALPGMTHFAGHATDRELTESGLPFSEASLFVWDSAVPEGLLCVHRDGGILVSCDSLQNWVEADAFFDEASVERMRAFGFIQPANIGPGWRRAAEPKAADFERVLALPFRHLLPAHGRPLRDEAHAQFSATFAREIGSRS